MALAALFIYVGEADSLLGIGALTHDMHDSFEDRSGPEYGHGAAALADTSVIQYVRVITDRYSTPCY